ncbi:group II intron reverse transcriptase/maturase [Amphritea pacifica]|uniref:group II intron reverse transcriptase/maturase n=1 Tax=Amphritea pacifica TaxID=2811233 RepID=UPI001964E854|nr:group II intron reverse transcriptase/maturase [Amphritea pacifica]MBN1009193.1 group II intron reverse transcriptase/maturase [Amphritea pacifica]
MDIAPDQFLNGTLSTTVGEACVNDNPIQLPIIEASLMEQVLDRNNLARALKQVKRNKGAAGVDGMTTEQLSAYLHVHWPDLKECLIDGRYRPQAVRRVEIPKADGKMRKLGIPTVIDRFIQQAIAQIISALWEPTFHPNSYGFRPQRNAQQAVRHAQNTIVNGKSWVIDLDLQAFFDTVNHDRLMARLKTRIQDRTLLKLVRRYLTSPIQKDGQITANREGVPQGGPLSPILANIVLDELDWELEKRGHCFSRYADDCQIYVGSRRAAERIKTSVQRYIEDHLRLKVNEDKSAVDRPWKRSFLGFTVSPRRGNRIKVADKALVKLKQRVRELSRRTRGHHLSYVIADLRKYLLGWKAYFGVAEVQSPLRDIDKWIRRKLRCYIWKQWGRSGYRKLRRLGVDRWTAWNTAKSAHGPWRISKSPALYRALPNRYFKGLGLPSLAA